LQAKYFLLHDGTNTITITYKKNRVNEFDALHIDLAAYNDEKVLIIDAKNKSEGVIEASFNLGSVRPDELKAVTIAE
jgi:hypothetical protein